ncbi:L-aminoadipate-semialdehyde dehydrogenase [Pseudozyma hubeiensis]|nr:L-aminoadipate-semialdehyde dehydrogenase [Pseudozyma hubeiensis]
MEPPTKRRQLLQRIAKTVGWANIHSPADAATLRNVIRSPRQVSPAWRPSDGLSGQHDSAQPFPDSRFGRNDGLDAHADDPNAIVELSSDSSQGQGAGPSSPAGKSHNDLGSQPWKSKMGRHNLAFLEPDEIKTLESTEPRLQRLQGERFKYAWDEDEATRRMINDQIFAGRLKWVDPASVNENQMWSLNKNTLRSSRILPLTNFSPIKLDYGGGSYNDVRMTRHGGMYAKWSWPKDHPLTNGQTFYMFKSIPEDRSGNAPVEILNYGIGYLDHADFPAVNEQLKKVKQEVASEGRKASQMHI